MTLFVVGILVAIFVGFIITEKYLSSSGFEYKENTYNCLVYYLKDKNVTDSYFPSTEHDINDLERNVNCSVILKQFNVLEDMKSNLYSSYNITSNLCVELMTDKKVCSSANDGKGSDNQSKNITQCLDVKKHFSVEQISKFDTSENLAKKFKEDCTSSDICIECVNQALTANEDYQNTILHAKAVNLTIIDYEIWNYFKISTRVKELLEESYEMEDKALSDCFQSKNCGDFVKIRNEIA